MTEPVVYVLIGFFVGAIVGGAVVGRSRTKEFEERIVELEEQNAVLRKESRMYLQGKINRIEQRIEEIDKAEKVEKKPVPKKEKERQKSIVELSKEYKSPEFDEHFSMRAHPLDDDEAGAADISSDDGLDDDPDNIFMISEQSYLRDLSKMNNESLTYYQEDGVLCDSHGEPIRDQVSVIGVECMEEVGGTEEDTLYVENDIYDMLYLIRVEHTKSFYADVLGI